jgi:glycosyltransferase involved in cell wall biosynthesis
MSGQRIALVISSLTSGGAERVLTTMANFWAAAGRDITVITMTGEDDRPFFPLADQVRRIALDTASASGSPARAVVNNLRRLRRLKLAIVDTRPDVVISFLDTTNVRTLLAARNLRVPVIVTEHTDPALKRLHPVWHRLRLLTYPQASRVVVLSESSKCYFPAGIRRITEIIPNPVRIEPAEGEIVRPHRRQIVALGRLAPEKGFDMVIDAFASIAPKFPEWELVIWGEGTERSALTRQRDRLDLTDRIRLPGRTCAPHHELRRADLFALSSRREGFPMALAEALACGVPAVAFDLPSGPRDMIRPGIDGLLVPPGDIGALAMAMADLMADPARRGEMARQAPHILERYGVARVMAIWDELLARVLAR